MQSLNRFLARSLPTAVGIFFVVSIPALMCFMAHRSTRFVIEVGNYPLAFFVNSYFGLIEGSIATLFLIGLALMRDKILGLICTWIFCQVLVWQLLLGSAVDSLLHRTDRVMINGVEIKYPDR